MNSRELLRKAAEDLRRAGVPDPEYDSGILLSTVTGLPPLELRLGEEIHPGEDQLRLFRNMMERRLKREPLQHIVGSAWFLGLEFATGPGALIPRPETEMLAEWAEEELRGAEAPEVLDLCCGSGCIGLSLAKRNPRFRVTLTDLSPDAIEMTKLNQKRLGTDCEVLRGDLFQPAAERAFDGVLSNPPYIPSRECDTLQAEVMFEPRMALDGGEDGMDFYRRILREALKHLRPHGFLLMEMGEGEAGAVAEAARERGAKHVVIRKDPAGIDRMILVRYD